MALSNDPHQQTIIQINNITSSEKKDSVSEKKKMNLISWLLPIILALIGGGVAWAKFFQENIQPKKTFPIKIKVKTGTNHDIDSSNLFMLVVDRDTVPFNLEDTFSVDLPMSKYKRNVRFNFLINGQPALSKTITSVIESAYSFTITEPQTPTNNNTEITTLKGESSGWKLHAKFIYDDYTPVKNTEFTYSYGEKINISGKTDNNGQFHLQRIPNNITSVSISIKGKDISHKQVHKDNHELISHKVEK